jgi:2'-5' RNA ligase
MISGELREKIVNLQEKILKLPLRAKLVERENLHITLSFLGEVPDFKVERIKSELGDICMGVEKFKVKISRLMPIPTEKYIRVMAFKVESEELENISKLIKMRIGGDVKPPHLTICRVKNVKNKESVLKWIKTVDLNASFLVEEISLIRSKLTRTGPIYSVIYSAKLR